MLLRLLDPEIRIAYFKVDPKEELPETRYPIAQNFRKFISTRVDLNKSGLLDIANTLPNEPSVDEIEDLAKSFADFFNYWLLRGLLNCIDVICVTPKPFVGLIQAENRDVFAAKLADQDCWFDALSTVSDWESLKRTVKERVIAYRAWANGNRNLPDSIRKSRTMIGEPLARSAGQLKLSGVISPTTNVFATIDQIEALWMQSQGKRELGQRLRSELHEVLGKRDDRVSYRIGARRYDWGKGGSLAMRDGRHLEEGRDFQVFDIDALLRRGEYAKNWTFRQLAKDVFQRRVQTAFPDVAEMPNDLHKTEQFFGPSPTPQEVVAQAIKKPEFNKLIKLDTEWTEAWRDEIKKVYHKQLPGIPQTSPQHCPFDPLNALLLAAWGLQTGGKGKAQSRMNRTLHDPPHSANQAPWNKAKIYWRKERYPQAVLQLVSRHQQKMLWWGESKVLSLCGGNILRFITICRVTWDYWQRLTDGMPALQGQRKCIVPTEIQSRAILEASRKVHEALIRQPGQPAGDVRSRFLNEVASWLRTGLLDDKSMSNPGQNGFSLRVSDLETNEGLRQLIEEAVGWGDLYEMDHTSKTKSERASEPRKKYYINPALSPFYELPEAHTKEPVYVKADDILTLARNAGAVAEGSPDCDCFRTRQEAQPTYAFSRGNMNAKSQFRPWGQLEWALDLSAPRSWRFFGCVAPEERSISALTALNRMKLLQSIEMLRIIDTEPADKAAEEAKIRERLATCTAQGLSIQPVEVALEGPLQNTVWKQRFTFSPATSFCLDISSLPKRFFFQAIKAALTSPNMRNFLIIYSKPNSYPEGSLSENHRDWETISGFGCEDPDKQDEAASRLVVSAGFAVDGLHDHLEGRSGDIAVDVLIPFPAGPWRSVRRSWESAREIEEALGYDPDKGLSEVKPSFHQVGALDTCTCFDKLLSLTRNAQTAATLAPLGPKPLSVAMCLLASQADHFPIYYAQPRTYTLEYSSGFKTTYAYWIKHNGANLYVV